MCFYVRCIDDGPSNIKKPILDWIKKGEVYTAYSFAQSLNSDDMSYYIKDSSGKKIEAHDGVPTWRADRFEPAILIPNSPPLFIQYLN